MDCRERAQAVEGQGHRGNVNEQSGYGRRRAQVVEGAQEIELLGRSDQQAIRSRPGSGGGPTTGPCDKRFMVATSRLSKLPNQPTANSNLSQNVSKPPVQSYSNAMSLTSDARQGQECSLAPCASGERPRGETNLHFPSG